MMPADCQLPVVKQWRVPLCLGSSLPSIRTVSPARRTSGEELGAEDEVTLTSEDGDGNAVVPIEKIKRDGMRASSSVITVFHISSGLGIIQQDILRFMIPAVVLEELVIPF